MQPSSSPSSSSRVWRASTSRGSISKRSGLAALLVAGRTTAASRSSPGRRPITPQHSFGASACACSITRASNSALIRTPLPPDGRVEIGLQLVQRSGVDPAGEVLPPLVGDDEDYVALLQLFGDPHRHPGNRPRGGAGKQPFLLKQLAGEADRVLVGDKDLPVEQGEVDDRRDEPFVKGAQPLHRLPRHRLGGNDLHLVAKGLLQPSAATHQRPAGAKAGDKGAHLLKGLDDLQGGA